MSHFQKILVVAITAAVAAVVWAQIDLDLPVSATADCFSVCVGNTNVKGVSGNVTITNAIADQGPATLGATVQLQCNGGDVGGASQTLGPVSVNPTASVTLPYSITFTPVAGCAYQVRTTATSSLLPGRRSIIATTFSTAACGDLRCGAGGCTLTQGFWKNHPDQWPVATLTLGTVTYSKAQLISILHQPVKGNGLVSLAHQLIAAKLNVANGATCAAISGIIAKADAIIGGRVPPPVGSDSLSTSSVSALVDLLDRFNSGLISGCPGHCAE